MPAGRKGLERGSKESVGRLEADDLCNHDVAKPTGAGKPANPATGAALQYADEAGRATEETSD